MGKLTEEDRTKAAALLSPLISENQALREKVEELEAFWPEWALKIKATLENYGVEFDDDEVDLPAAFDQWCVDFEEACKRDAARSEAQPSGYDGSKSLGERLYEAVANLIGTCIRWRPRQRPFPIPRGWMSRFGGCHAPPAGPAPYWRAERPDAVLMIADCHGEGCLAYKQKRCP